MTRHIKRGGRIWIRVFPDKPISQSRRKCGWVTVRAARNTWVAEIQPGKVLYEMDGVDEALARGVPPGCPNCRSKPSSLSGWWGKNESFGIACEDASQLNAELLELLKAQFSLRMQIATPAAEQHFAARQGSWDIARVKTILREKAGAENERSGQKNKRVEVGRVVSDKMTNTVTVLVERRVKHRCTAR